MLLIQMFGGSSRSYRLEIPVDLHATHPFRQTMDGCGELVILEASWPEPVMLSSAII